MDTKEILTLVGPKGQTSKIYPVTRESTVTSLFRNSKDGKTTTLSQLRFHICPLITEADPDACTKAHDIRKGAASLTLQQCMQVGDLNQESNWSSPAMFYKLYSRK